MKRSKNNKAARGVVVLLFLVFVLTILPLKTDAVSVFSPFGGKIATYIEEAPGCAPLTVLTLGAVTVSQITLSSVPPKSLGILKIYGVTVPLLTTIYAKGGYSKTDTNVLGLSLNVCDICSKVEDIPFAKVICDIGVISSVMESVCSIVSTACPIGNLVYKMGTSESSMFGAGGFATPALPAGK